MVEAQINDPRSLTYDEANDFLLSCFKNAWDDILDEEGKTYPVHYDNVIDQEDIPDDTLVKASVIVRHGNSELTSLGGKGHRSFTRNGILVIKVSILQNKGLTEFYKCANMIAKAFEGKKTRNSMWFDSVSINELGVDGNYYESEVVVTFQYDQVK